MTLPGDFNIFCFICVYNKDYNRKKKQKQHGIEVTG